MTNKNNKKENNTVEKGSDMGAGLVAVGAALAAGYYFYVSDNAKKNRKMVAGWATSLKDEVLDRAKSMNDSLNKDSLLGIIDDVAQNYYVAKNVTREDVGVVVKELKENWSKVLGELKESKKSTQAKILKSKKKNA